MNLGVFINQRWEIVPVSVKTTNLCKSLCPATKRQKLLSTSWFGFSKARFPLFLRRNVFSQTPVAIEKVRTDCAIITATTFVKGRTGWQQQHS